MRPGFATRARYAVPVDGRELPAKRLAGEGGIESGAAGEGRRMDVCRFEKGRVRWVGRVDSVYGIWKRLLLFLLRVGRGGWRG